MTTDPALYLPIGPPGAGKSTMGKLMVEAGVFDEYAIVCPDFLREQLTGKRGDQSENYAVFSICQRIAAARMQRQLPVYFDSTNIRPEWRADMITLANAAGMRIVSILFEVDGDICRYRNASQHRIDLGARVPDDIMDLMMTRFSSVTKAELPGTVIKSQMLENLLHQTINRKVSSRSTAVDTKGTSMPKITGEAGDGGLPTTSHVP